MKMKLLRLCSLILAFSLMINMIPVHSFAVETEEEETSELVEEKEIEEGSQIINEIIENRTQFSKEYRMTNGLYMMMLYPEAIHYEKDDQWEDIDNTLKLAESRAGNVYTNTAGIWNVAFPQGLTSDNGITIAKDEYMLNFRMGGALHRAGTQAEIMEETDRAELETTPIEETVGILDVTEATEEASSEEGT